jgi:protein-S-isoprenylcysteine O-methyltransferase Ste14
MRTSTASLSPTEPPQGAGWVVAQFVLMLALLCAGPLWRKQWPGNASLIVGAGLVLAGAWLGIAGVRVLGMNRTPFPEPKPGSQLVTTGIYARVRHPLYASVIALGFGCALLWRSGAALALAVVEVIFFYAKARFEERRLCEQFAAYSEYARRVPRFLPRLFTPASRLPLP